MKLALALLLAAPALARPSRCKPAPAVDPTVSAPEAPTAGIPTESAPAQSASWVSSVSASEATSASEVASVAASVSASVSASAAAASAAASSAAASTASAVSAVSTVSESESTSSAASTASTASTASASASVAPTASTSTSAPSSTASSTWDYLGATSFSGTSTFYGGNLHGGNCLFSTMDTLPAGIYGTAYSGAVWDNAAECGACVEVVGVDGATIKAMIVDQCPECEPGHLDLFPDAFTALGGTAGLVDTTYRFVPCGITSPLILHNKEGTSGYYFAMQVVNANEPVAALEVSTDGGNTWSPTTRATYNYFEYQSGFGAAKFDVRVTSITGATVTYAGATPDADALFTAASNF